jgi:hypothetical protein
MNDDIEQLLTQLRLKPLREIVERELARAQKAKPSYAEFYARILREHYALMQTKSVEYRILRARLPVNGLGDPREFDREGPPKNDRRAPQENDHGARGDF